MMLLESSLCSALGLYFCFSASLCEIIYIIFFY